MERKTRLALYGAGGLAVVGGGYLAYRKYGPITLTATHSTGSATTSASTSANASATATGSATTTGSAQPGPGSTSTGSDSTGATNTGSTNTGSTHTGSTSTGSGPTGSGTTTASAGSLPDWQALEDGPFSDGNTLQGNYVVTASGGGPIPEALVHEAATFEQQRQAAVIAAAKSAFTGNKSVPATDNPFIVPSVPSGYVATWATGYGWNIVQAGNTWLAQVPAMIRQMGQAGTGTSATGATNLEEMELSAQYQAASNFAPVDIYLIPASESPGGAPEYLQLPAAEAPTAVDVHFTSPQLVYTAQPTAADGPPGPTILGGGNPGGPWDVLSSVYQGNKGPLSNIPSGYTGLLLSIPTGIQVFAKDGQFVGRTS